ncbi:MAG: CYTH domain-containing protein [Saccharofermentans sp.]|nr:CYTH domain-containing protein [Saccharofermentans sp.]
METEIKLRFADEKSLYEVLDSDWFASYCTNPGNRRTYLLENRYIDTADMKVSMRGGMIRSRHYSGNSEDFHEFTVKYGGGVEGGLHKRHEWNLKSDDGVFAIDKFKSGCSGSAEPSKLLDEVLEGITDSDLILLCSNSFTRTTSQLKLDNSIIEACFDYGAIEDSEGIVREYICELELELLSGTTETLETMANIVREHASCEPFDDTKYHRTIRYIKKS